MLDPSYNGVVGPTITSRETVVPWCTVLFISHSEAE